MAHDRRKADHIRINIEENVQFPGLTNGFECYRLTHQALPELNLAEVETGVSLLGKRLQAPLLISSMTGGTEAARAINHNLARGAQACGVAMGLGSQRAGIDQAETADTFRVRDLAPDVLLFANRGVMQLNYGYTVDQCRRAVELIEADALSLHLNPLQEALQPEGHWQFTGLLGKIEAICRTLEVPVVVKEVGWGLSETRRGGWLMRAVSALDVAGSGGTSWSEVEITVLPLSGNARLAQAFAEWGIPAADTLLMALRGAAGLPLIASGGMRNGLEVAIALAMGATAVGIASPFLKAAAASADEVIETIDQFGLELRTAMFCAGAGCVEALREPGRIERVS